MLRGIVSRASNFRTCDLLPRGASGRNLSLPWVQTSSSRCLKLSAPFRVQRVQLEDFTDSKVVYRSHSNADLLRSFLVFQMCSSDFLVDRQAKLLKLAKTLLGRSAFERLMEATIFGQFMVREEEGRILEQLRKQVDLGVLPMLTYTAAEFHGGASSTSSGESKKPGLDSWVENNFRKVLKSLEVASKCHDFCPSEPVVPTKVTFLTRCDVLRTFDEVINVHTKFLKNYEGEKDEEVTLWLKERIRDGNLSSLLQSANFHLDFNKFLSKSKRLGDKVNLLSPDEIKEIESLVNKMKTLSQAAFESKITLNIDAEQTYLQTAIENLVLDLQRAYNRDKPVVLNTYQCYLKRTNDVVSCHLDLARREGFCFGAKIVRGAYMIEEKNLAKAENYPEPVNESYDATTRMYERVTDTLLEDIDLHPEAPRRLIFATHNQESIVDILRRLDQKGIDPEKHGISFAQLIGMRDFITNTLGQWEFVISRNPSNFKHPQSTPNDEPQLARHPNAASNSFNVSYDKGWKGIPVSKLVHYSNPVDGLAYLSRRLNENRSGLKNTEIERKLPLLELKRRLLSRFKSDSP